MDAERETQLKELECTLDSTQKWTTQILDQLEWTKEHILQDDRVPCPNDSSHLVHQKSLTKHCELCPKLAQGYTKEELEKDQSSAFFYEKSNMVVPIPLDDKRLHTILSLCGGGNKPLPLTLERYLSDLTSAERLRIYEFCMQSVKAMNKQVSIPEEELMLLEDTKKSAKGAQPKSYLEKVAEQRDFKRRRQSYRAKNVHITKKSHTEIIREVILSQMEILSEMWEDERSEAVSGSQDNTFTDNGSRRSKSQDRHRRSRSRSQDRRRRSRSREGDRPRRRSLSRERKHQSRSRGHRRREASRERRHLSRSRSRERKHRSRSKDRKHRSDERKYKASHKSKQHRSQSRSRSRSREKDSNKKHAKVVNLWNLPVKSE